MKIDDHPIEMEAMEAFHRGDYDEAHKLQDKFVGEFHEKLKRGEKYCPCPEECKYHGRCIDCIAIHRGHGDHLPHCMYDILNRRLEKLSELSGHTIVRQIQNKT